MRASRSRAGFATALLAVVGLPACDNAVETPLEPQLSVWGQSGGDHALSVYTQNVYLGGDTGPLFAIDLTNIPLVVDATNAFWQVVQSSGGPERAAAIVDQIEERLPHLVGLQEVLQFAVLNAAFQPTGTGLDFLAEVESEIEDRDLPYETLLVQAATSSALPLAFDATIPGVTQWLAFTDRVVTLRRTDVEVVGTAKGNYQAYVPLGTLQFKRGWTRASVEHGSTVYHFLTTQLETQQIPQVQALQAAELLGSIVADLEGVTILSGDFNSDAEGGPGDPNWTPTYGELIEAGFFDVWDSAPPAHRGDGLTCCHAKDLVTPLPFDQRIDFVLVRGSSDESDRLASQRGLFRADVVGEEERDRTTSGRWPSDHAGLMASMRAVP